MHSACAYVMMARRLLNTTARRAYSNTFSKTSTVTLNDSSTISVLGLGTYQPYLYEDTNAESLGETEQAVLFGLKHGYRLFDTASCYRNETEVGRAILKSGISRERVTIVTKLWDADHGRDCTLTSFHRSLENLGVEYIDLYLMHSPMGGKLLETWDAMTELKDKGLARSIGVCSFNVHHLKQLKLARPHSIPAVNQLELHPYLGRNDCIDYCQQERIQIMAYAPLTKGLKLGDTLLIEMAQRYGKSTAQLLIRWSLQCGFVCIPKSVKEHRIVENGDVFDFSISDEDMQVLNGLDENLITDWDPMSSAWQP